MTDGRELRGGGETFWRRCSTCKREIAFESAIWKCSVSTCNRKGSSFVFCSVDCWQSHVPTMRHREAWAEEERSPGREAWKVESAAAVPDSPERETLAKETADAARAVGSVPSSVTEIPREILIVTSKLKKYVKARSGLNTSDAVMSTLSDRVRRLCDDAIERAREEGRKTLMDRDF